MKKHYLLLAVLVFITSCATTNTKPWNDVTYEKFVADILNGQNKPDEATKYGSTWAGYFYKSPSLRAAEKLEPSDPDFVIKQFREWCLANGGTYTFSRDPSGAASEFTAAVLEATRYGLDGKQILGPRRLGGYDCQGSKRNVSVMIEVLDHSYLALFFDEPQRAAFVQRTGDLRKARIAREAAQDKEYEQKRQETKAKEKALWEARVQELQRNPKVGTRILLLGDATWLGNEFRFQEALIVDVRPPLVQVQYDEGVARGSSRSKWVPIKEIMPLNPPR